MAPLAASAAGAGIAANVLAQVNDDGNCVNGFVDGDVLGDSVFGHATAGLAGISLRKHLI